MAEAAEPPPEGADLHAPVARLLRPLVRLFVARGITFPALTTLLRELYVNVAENDFALPGKEQTDSRVSLLTGIHRKEVSRLRGAGAPVGVGPSAVSRTSRIVARWRTDPRFTDASGHPLPLGRIGEGDAPSFENLVAAVTRDLRPRAVLDAWLDRGLVIADPEGRIVLAEAADPSGSGGESPLEDFGRNLHDHIVASVVNLTGPAPRFLERAVHHNGLSRDLAERLEARAREIALEALRQAEREARAARETDPGGSHRWSFGLYVYAEPTMSEGGTHGTTPPLDGPCPAGTRPDGFPGGAHRLGIDPRASAGRALADAERADGEPVALALNPAAGPARRGRRRGARDKASGP